ncbi:MAG: hypothetical protein ACXAEU_21415 [Candidatus Hodarchaeales archaeon]
MLPLIEELKPYTRKHPSFNNFKQFLEQYYEISTLYIKLLSDTEHELSNLIKTGQVNDPGLFDQGLLRSQENLKYVQEILRVPELPSIDGDQQDAKYQQDMDEKLSETYNRLKYKLYQEFRENLTSATSRQAIARAIIGTELLLEQRPLTQEELEKATSFQRSVISDTLNLLLEMKMIQLIKKPRDRKKYYSVIKSWDIRMINRLRLNVKYAMEVKEEISDLKEEIESRKEDEMNNSLLMLLQDVLHSYEQYEQYFKLLEVKYLNIRLGGHSEPEKISQM